MTDLPWIDTLLSGQKLETIPKDDDEFRISMQYAIFEHTKNIYNEWKP